MNTIVIKKDNSAIFDRICHSPLSAEDKTFILDVLKNHKFSNLGYSIEIICGSNHKKFTGCFYSVDKFFEYIESLCKGGVRYGIVVYLNY